MGEVTSSGSVLTLLSGLNVGAATVGTSTADVLVITKGIQTFAYKMARAA